MYNALKHQENEWTQCDLHKYCSLGRTVTM